MTRVEAIAAITSRLVEYYHPERIYLFGSAARGDAGPDSDLDFCVVVPDDAPVELLRDGGIYSVLRGMGYPKTSCPGAAAISMPARHTFAPRCLLPSFAKANCSMTPDQLRCEEARAWLDRARTICVRHGC